MKRAFALGAVFAGGCLAALAGCGDESDGGSGGAGGGTGGGNGGACKPQAAECYVAGPEGVGSECLARADYSGSDVVQMRVTSHQVASPLALASPFVQDAIITKKSTLLEPSCNLDGSGQFNLLMELDTANNTMKVGGGVPQALIGPISDGTCFANFKDTASGLDVAPVQAATTVNADGALEAKFPFFVMPIYLEDKADQDSYVLVPLHEMTFTAKLSKDKGCVGRFAPERLDQGLGCQPNESEFAWDPGGRYEGYITVDEADNVFVVSLGQTLCVVLTGDPSKWKGPSPDSSCVTSKGFTETGGMPKGDWCSTTNSAGGCQDSWRLVIDVAAQAIKINGDFGAGCP